MEVNFLSFTSYRGGAAKATFRFLKAIEQNNIKIQWYTIEKNLYNYSFIKTPSFLSRMIHKFFWYLSGGVVFIFIKNNKNKQSLNLFGSNFAKNMINKSSLIHVHWINNETLNINDFKLLSNKSIITLHDEWFYCGCEHHALKDEELSRVLYGVDSLKTYLGLSDMIFLLKEKKYKELKNVIFTVPSNWMKERAQQSLLLSKSDIRVIPNPINIEVFKQNQVDNIIVPNFLKKSDFVLLFGAVDGDVTDIKGFSILLKTLKIISSDYNISKKLKILTFGSNKKGYSEYYGIQSYSFGYINDEYLLTQLYSLASITVVPSKIESFGQVAAESLSCETPVLAFNYSGLTDIVKHKENGFLAEPFSSNSLAEGIKWFYSLNKRELERLGANGRRHIEESFSDKIVGSKLIKLYNEILKID